jgi:hypothetical protein
MEASRGLIVSLASWMQSTNSDTEDEPGNAAHLAGSHLGRQQVPAVDRPFETAVCCPLRRHTDCRWGDAQQANAGRS